MTGLPADFGLFTQGEIASTLDKERAIIERLGLADYLHALIPSDTQRSTSRKPKPTPSRRERNNPDNYQARLNYWEQAKAICGQFDPAAFSEQRLKLALALMADMTDTELLYGYLRTDNEPLGQAYGLALENRKLMRRPLKDIVGETA